MPHPAIFVNIPVTSLKTAEPFYFALGFKKTEYSSDDTTGLQWSDNIFVMIMVSLCPISLALVRRVPRPSFLTTRGVVRLCIDV
jgi:hypothetical protein